MGLSPLLFLAARLLKLCNDVEVNPGPRNGSAGKSKGKVRRKYSFQWESNADN
jgi:hypothetical protein